MNDKKLIYKEPEKMNRNKLIRALETGTIPEIENAIVSIAFYEDKEFALKSIFKLASNSDQAIRGTAILCIGHLARIHRDLPEEETLNIIEKNLKDQSIYVRAQAESAASDINTFIPGIGRKIKGRIIPTINLEGDNLN